MGCVFAIRPTLRQVQDQSPPRPAQDGATGEHLGAQRRGLAVDRQPGGALKLRKQVEQQQDGLEGGFGGEEFLQTEAVGSEVVLEFGDAVSPSARRL